MTLHEQPPKVPSECREFIPTAEAAAAKPAVTHRPTHIAIRTLGLLVLFCLAPRFCLSQTRDMLCIDGYMRFETLFETGVRVFVGPASKGGLESRACTATLEWNKRILPVVSDAAEVDIDALGADLGLGGPVVAFQVSNPGLHSYLSYEIYSLQEPPRLLRTITGGTEFSASDKDLDGRVEIWAGDASAVDGFDGMAIDDFDFAPTLVLRFEGGRLMDASAQFQPYYDEQIAGLRNQVGAQDLIDFKKTDGRMLADSPLPEARRNQMLVTKARVLEIVTCFLYSGREQQAWDALAAMWPAADYDRIRAAILDARSHGMHAQVEGTSLPPRKRAKALVYEAPDRIEPRQAQPESPATTADAAPFSIELWVPPSTPKSEAVLYLTLDAAGKVRSVKPIGDVSPEILSAATTWKYVPAFKNGHAVACQTRFLYYPVQ